MMTRQNPEAGLLTMILSYTRYHVLGDMIPHEIMSARDPAILRAPRLRGVLIPHEICRDRDPVFP